MSISFNRSGFLHALLALSSGYVRPAIPSPNEIPEHLPVSMVRTMAGGKSKPNPGRNKMIIDPRKQIYSSNRIDVVGARKRNGVGRPPRG